MIGGVFSPTVTAMTEDGIDVRATRRHIERLVDAGVHGLCPGGSGGEFVGLSEAERKRFIDEQERSGNDADPIPATHPDVKKALRYAAQSLEWPQAV